MPPYNPPTRVRTLEIPYRALLVRADPEFEAERRKQIEYEFTDRNFHGNPAVRGSYDGSRNAPEYDNLVLLMHMDGANGSTAFTDATGRHIVRSEGNAVIDTSQSKFGGASARFSGGNDYLYLDGHPDFRFGNADWTVDFWVRYATLTGTHVLYDQRFPDASIGLIVATLFTNAYWIGNFAVNPAVNAFPLTINTNQWYHIGVARAFGSLRLFIDGVQVGSTYTDSHYYDVGSTSPRIGGYGYQPEGFDGWIDELRVLRGYGAFTGNFIPPTEPY